MSRLVECFGSRDINHKGLLKVYQVDFCGTRRASSVSIDQNNSVTKVSFSIIALDTNERLLLSKYSPMK